MEQDLVAAWYNRNAALEDSRLESARVEYAITLRIIKDLLARFSSPCRVADIGCGTGKYALELANLSHQLSICDISSAEIDMAKDTARRSGMVFEHAAILDARQLQSDPHMYREKYFDLVLLLGPLYHLTDAQDRANVLESAARILKPGGFMVVSFVTRVAHLRDLAGKDPQRLVRESRCYAEYFKSGIYNRGTSTPMYHSSPEDIVEQMGQVPALGGADSDVQLIGSESFLGYHRGTCLNGLNDKEMETWIGLLLQYAGNKYLLACSDHILAVARRPA